MHKIVIGGGELAYATISDLAGRYGVSLRTLRFYEQRGLLAPIRVGTTRLYAQPDCQRLELILKGKRFGFSLTEIETLISAACEGDDRGSFLNKLYKKAIAQRLDDLERKRQELDAALTELRAAARRSKDSDTGAA